MHTHNLFDRMHHTFCKRSFQILVQTNMSYTPITDAAWKQRDGESPYQHEIRKRFTCETLERDAQGKACMILP
jgi:hypothetical protein